MKTNEAPEKIYVKITHPFSEEYTEIIAFENGSGIEYTRTDAFVEKACDTIKRLLGGYVIRNFHFGDSYDMDEIIKDFKRDMKGE